MPVLHSGKDWGAGGWFSELLQPFCRMLNPFNQPFHGLIRGIHLGTFFLYMLYSSPNRFFRPFSSQYIKYTVFIAKNNANHAKISHESKIADSPKIIISTPDNIGFLTCAYGPETTSFFVGFHGASVPFPIVEKRYIVHAASANPAMNKTAPAATVAGVASLYPLPKKINKIAGIVTTALKGKSIIALRQAKFMECLV